MAGRPAARRHLGIKRIAHLSASGLGASSYGVNPPLLFGPGGGLRLPIAPASAQLQIDSAWFVAERLIAVPLNLLDRGPKSRGSPLRNVYQRATERDERHCRYRLTPRVHWIFSDHHLVKNAR